MARSRREGGIADRAQRNEPRLLVRGARICLSASPALERLVGWSARELERRGWCTVLFGDLDGARVTRALGEEVVHLPVVLRARDGGRIRAAARIQLRRAGRRAQHEIVLEEVASQPTLDLGEVWNYVVRTAPRGWGELLEVRPPSGEPVRSAKGWRCHELFAASGAPCPRCPVVDLRRRGERHRGVVPLGEGNGLRIVIGEQLAGERAATGTCVLEPADVSALLLATIAHQADRANLSVRERQVLELLTLGRTTEQIGRALDIRPRTVKFHAANLLHKLGADSRADLLRVLL